MAEQPNDEPDIVVIRAEIEETRTQMGDTLDEIGERLRPSHIKQQIGQGIHDATVGRVEDAARQAADSVTGAGRRVVELVRDNPIPLAMIGIGVGWLLWGGRGSSSSDYRNSSQPESQSGMSAVADKASEAAGAVADRARDMASSVRRDARLGARAASSQLQENPLVIGAVAAAIGLAAGLAIPETRQEQELMGAARDRLVERAKDVAAETKEKLQTVAERTIDQAKTAATDAAREEGLTQ
jgi:ElaB/YqjD/DUF883 family membrane-anchored ribosome-binding protein